ncbi:helix-turn-helix domain-containing protein [Candidatus Palauibacter sp.]|uniref:helix-turn-helix domain-containing protein n=1 Tax=Candidatus Palauibacter sp. TaxID=3101350 RepID=UPI003AF25728
MPQPSVFGGRLLAVRLKRGLSQAELATKTGLSPAVISHFETGVRQFPSADTLVKLTDALQVSTDYLLGRVKDMGPRGGDLEVLWRRIGMDEASDDVIDTLTEVAKALVAKKKRDGEAEGQ